MSTRKPISRALSRLVVDGLLPRIDSRLEASRRPFNPHHDILRPRADGGRWTATHYGVFIPDLPAPHRYLDTMTLIGATGASCSTTPIVERRTAHGDGAVVDRRRQPAPLPGVRHGS